MWELKFRTMNPAGRIRQMVVFECGNPTPQLPIDWRGNHAASSLGYEVIPDGVFELLSALNVLVFG